MEYYNVIIDSLIDTARLIPFLFAVHLLINFLEVRKTGKIKRGILQSRFAPLFGTGLALLPQCGFSVVAGELYSKKLVTAGTLVAVFIATSDEALPILIGEAAADPSAWAATGILIGIKVIMALTAGYGVELICGIRRRVKNPSAATEKTEKLAAEDGPHGDEHSHEHDGEYLHAHEHGCCGHSIGEEHGKGVFSKYFAHPIIHTCWITLFVFIVNLALGTVIFFVKEDNFRAFMDSGTYIQPLVAVLIGLIPNCASSVMITELFAGGELTLGAAVAGLAVNAGLGMAVLIKENKNAKQNALIIGGIVLFATAVGYALTPLGAIV